MRWRLHPLSLPLRVPLRTAGWEIARRDVVIVEAVHDNGQRGFGEAAPLPAFGTETLPQSVDRLRQWTAILSSSAIDLFETVRTLDTLLPDVDTAPATRCAVECALLDLAARMRRLPLWRLLADAQVDNAAVDTDARGIPVNIMLSAATAPAMVDAARAALREGFRCFKLKVGMGSVEEDAHRVRLLRDTLGGDAVIRLDANGAWDETNARAALERFAELDIEYIEQPVAADDLAALRRLRALRLVPVAADESVQRPEQARAILALGAADVLILKPMALGGILRARALFTEARAAGVDAVCTGFIDSAVGRAAVAQLCASLPAPLRAQGLATGSMLTSDTGQDDIREGTLWLPRGDGLGFIPALEDSSHASA